MKGKIATSLTVLVALLAAAPAHALFGDEYGMAPINEHPLALQAAPAIQGNHAFWAGACERAAAPGFGINLATVGNGTGFGARPSTILAAAGRAIVPRTGGTPINAQESAPAPGLPDHCLDPGAPAYYPPVGTFPARPWQVLPYNTGVPHPSGSGTIGQSGPAGSYAPKWRQPALTQAGARPDGSTLMNWNRSKVPAYKGKIDGNVDNVYVSLPPGFVGNPQAVPYCTNEQFALKPLRCPPESQVGIIRLNLEADTVGSPSNFSSLYDTTYPVYNLEPRQGRIAELGFAYAADFASVRIAAAARTNGDFGITAFAGQVPAALALVSQEITFWGVPWAAENDIWRTKLGHWEDNAKGTACRLTTGFVAQETKEEFIPPNGLPGVGCQARYQPSWGEIKPFLANETDCNPAPTVTLHTDAYQHPGAFTAEGDPDPADADWKTYASVSPPVTGCEDLAFQPAITLEPVKPGGVSNQEADSASGLDVKLDLPQNNDLPFDPPAEGSPQVDIDQYVADAGAHWHGPAGYATAHLRDSAVTLPPGMTLNPAAAGGQQTCSMAQIGVTDIASPVPPRIRFDNQPVACPEASRVGEVVVETPVLPAAEWPRGNVYLATQGANPFNSDFAIYIAIESPQRGFIAKLAGKVTPNPVTGQLTTTVTENPELPFDTFHLRFERGPRAPLATPTTCGTHTSTNSFTSHAKPTSSVTVNDPFSITSNPAGGCPTTPEQRPFNLGFSAGSTEIVAGTHSPFTVRITRPDGNQELDRIEITTPEGLAAKLAGVPYCSEASIAQAQGRTASGDGAKEQANPSCSSASKVGTTTIGAGAGSQPFFVKGDVYLAGPYKGAPLSLAFIVPAVAGPFDLGVQVVRTALNVNPRNAQVTAVSDTIPKILGGVPVRIRDIRVDVDRPGFILNPTDCSEQMVSGKVYGASGASTNVSNRFQIAECARLGFKPSLSLKLKGGTKRTKYQGLQAIVTPRPGDANIAATSVTMPRSAFLAQEHIRTVCTRVQFAADQCPQGSIYGKAKAWSPLLDEPLSGNVYLRSSSNKLPDLVTDLRGPAHQPIRVELSGRTDSFKGALRNTFDIVPDAPVTKFELQLFGGSKGLIVNSQDLCRKKHFATVKMTGQNGRTHNFRPVVKNGCKKIVPKKAKKKAKQGKKGSAKQRPVASSRSLADIARGLF